MKVGSYAFKGNRGVDPQLISGTENSDSVRTGSWGWTLFVVATGAIGTQLDVDVQDSADGSSWTTVKLSPETPAANGVHFILVKNLAVREYLRAQLVGATNPIASIAIVQINDTSGSLVGGCDLVID